MKNDKWNWIIFICHFQYIMRLQKSNDVYKFCTNWLKVRTATDENDNYRVYNNVKFWVVEESVGVRIQNKYFNFCLARFDTFLHIFVIDYDVRYPIIGQRWIYLQYPRKTGNGRKKKVTKIQIDIIISCRCGQDIIKDFLTVCSDITKVSRFYPTPYFD